MNAVRKKRYYGPRKGRRMFLKIEATRLANIHAAAVKKQLRATDPLEIAKAGLRRAGYVVFPLALIQPGSEMIVVDRKLMNRGEVIAYAKRHGRNSKED